ncbi:MAG: lysylphosphatidylglycerol synthase transmembrane domain-containing protein [Candidatus Zixiibacteriota bacterium]
MTIRGGSSAVCWGLRRPRFAVDSLSSADDVAGGAHEVPTRPFGFAPMQAPPWRWIRILGLLAAFAVLVYMFRDSDPLDIWRAIVGMHPRYLIPVLAGAVGMPVFRALRLRFIMPPAEQTPERHLSQRRVFAVYNVGQLLNIILPVLTGQVARVLLFSRTLGMTKTSAFTMVILEVLFDGLILVVMIFATSFLFVMPEWMVRGEVAVLFACAMLFGFFYWALRHRERSALTAGWFRRRAPARLVREWDSVSASFLDGLKMLRSSRHLSMVGLLSVSAWLSHALLVLFLLRAFAFDIPFWGAMVILIVNTVVIMVPVSPGNIGTFQLACVVGLAFFGVRKDEALGFSILLHVTEVGPVFVLGSIASFSQHVRLREYKSAQIRLEQERLATTAPVFDHFLDHPHAGTGTGHAPTADGR